MRGRHSTLLAEMAVKVGDVGVAHLEADVGHRAFGVRQELAGSANAQLSRIVDEIGALKKREKADCVIPAIAAASDILTFPERLLTI